MQIGYYLNMAVFFLFCFVLFRFCFLIDQCGKGAWLCVLSKATKVVTRFARTEWRAFRSSVVKQKQSNQSANQGIRKYYKELMRTRRKY